MDLWLPPRWLRRLVLAPAVWFLGVWLLLLTLPTALLLLLLVSFALPGWLKPLRVGGFAVVYLACEVVALTVCFLTWVASGFGWALRRPFFVRLHYGLMRGLLETLFVFARRFFQLTVVRAGSADPDDLDGDGAPDDRPRIVMSRHAGPGDSFLLVREILSWTGRRPRIVLKDTLQIDPMVDVLLNRLPMVFVPHRAGQGDATVAAIELLASSMGEHDALLIFPEGGNFTELRRQRGIDRLLAAGLEDAAARAGSLEHLLAPRPGGIGAALRAAPSSDVVVVAHTGLERLTDLRTLWREIPVAKTLYVGWQVHPAASVPTGTTELSEWLFDRWTEIDAWIDEVERLEPWPVREVPPFGDLTPANAPGRVGRRRGSPPR
ncbi:MAG: 1-acyl-sn-glycerol-3-phosphate acyltransferase [Candidatus Nanopelagicales bacterium]